MKYTVDVKDTSYATIIVEASTKEEAEALALEKYYAGTMEWEDCDIDIEARVREQNRGER